MLAGKYRALVRCPDFEHLTFSGPANALTGSAETKQHRAEVAEAAEDRLDGRVALPTPDNLKAVSVTPLGPPNGRSSSPARRRSAARHISNLTLSSSWRAREASVLKKWAMRLVRRRQIRLRKLPIARQSANVFLSLPHSWTRRDPSVIFRPHLTRVALRLGLSFRLNALILRLVLDVLASAFLL